MKTAFKMLASLGLAAAGLGFTLATSPAATAQGSCQSTVTTGCGNTYTYSSCNVRVQTSSSNGQTTSTIFVDGRAVKTESCASSSGGGFDICSIVPFLCR